MARVTFVKKAQQRYATVPLLDESGQQKVVPVMKRDGVTPKTDKHGKAITRRLTIEDKTRPRANRKCDKCGKEIEPGHPYKWIAPKSGPYGGQKKFRCGECPTWNVWEYSSSLGARTAEIASNFQDAFDALDPCGEEIDEDFDGSGILDDVRSALSEAAEAIKELAQEKSEGADNIEEGFGHETSQSQELRDTAEQLENWAEDVENADLPDFPVEEYKTTCEVCGGSGEAEAEDGEDGDTQPCEPCEGSGEVFDEEAAAESISSWWSDVEAAVAIIDECPV